MLTFFRSVLVIALVAGVGVGCTGEKQQPATATPATAPGATAAPSATATPGANAAEVATLRQVVAAIESGSPSLVRSLISLSSRPCTLKSEGPGSPPQCPAGTAEGTPVDVFPAAGCEGYFLFPAELDAALAGQLGAVYGALRRLASRGPFEAPFAIVSNVSPAPGSKVSNPAALWGVDSAGRIVSFSSQCGANAREIADQVLQQGGSWVIEPVTVGVPVVDAVIAAVVGGDASALKGLFAYFKAICSKNPSGGFPQPPKCHEEEADGTLVDVLFAAPGEGLYFRAEEADRELAGWLSAGMRLYSVKDLGTVTDILGVPRYQVVFVNSAGAGNSLTISTKGVVGLWFDVSRNPAQQANSMRGTFLIPPRE